MSVLNEENCLFVNYKNQPPELQAILERYELDDADYNVLDSLLLEVEAIGYTFQFELDASPFNLIKIPDKKIEILDWYSVSKHLADAIDEAECLKQDSIPRRKTDIKGYRKSPHVPNGLCIWICGEHGSEDVNYLFQPI